MKINNIKFKNLSLFTQHVLLILVGFGAGYAANSFVIPIQNPQLHQPQFQQIINHKERATSVCFTPNKRCQMQIIEEINKAKKSIYVQGYSFTDRGIAEALVRAVKRGVNVQVLLDKSNKNDKRSVKNIILRNKIPIRFDSPPGIAHNKIIVIDQSIVLSGSYNFSTASYKKNTENLLILNNPDLARDYIHNWYKRWDVSKKE